ncbi:MAG TPA: hypothetical protein VLM11_19485 [Streptosporangiaceae bacterium]|nr:hypothetical protein [Streptosporangiaceae bacterium]
MNPKPPVTRTGKPGWLGHQATRLKSLAVVGAVTLGFAGAAFAAAAPASADPAFQFVAVGSDTTQNVMDFFAGQTSGGIIGSYDAVNPVTQTGGEIITPGVAGSGGAQQNCSFTRPNGSGQGFKALDFSFNTSTTLAQLAVPPQAGCLAFSRSSGGPGSGTSATTGPGVRNTSGALVYIPFALDAVTDATGPTTAIQVTTKCNGPTTPTGFTCSSTTGLGTVTYTTTPTHITNAGMFTVANLQTLYGTCSPVTVGGVTYNPAAGGNIDLYAPQNGSGTLSFWQTAMGVTSVQTCWHQTVAAGPATGVSVEEHDGTALASDPNGIAPISIAKWLAFSNGVVTPDVRFGDILEPIVVGTTAVQPTSGGVLNTSFPITREVFNVMSWSAVTSGQSGFNSTQAGLFASTNSALCQSSTTIQVLGFGLLPAASQPDSCGSTANSLRVQETNNGPS